MPSLDAKVQQERRLKFARAVQFGVYCWAMRLGFAGIGSVLVSLVQLFVPADTNALKLHHLHIMSWTSVVKSNYRSVKDSAEPILYQGVGVISSELLKAKFAKIVPLSSTALKSADVRDYMYFDETRLWSGKYAADRGYTYVSAVEYLKSKDGSINLDPFLDTLNGKFNQEYKEKTCHSDAGPQGVCENASRYIYGTHNNALSSLPALSPALAQYVSLESSAPQVCLWMSSLNVSAGLHFDLEDNFLLQVSGVKKIVLVSPEALSLLNPHSSWHPHWRQASTARGIYSSRDILSHMRASLNDSTSSLKKDASLAVDGTTASVNTVDGTRSSFESGTGFGEIKTWEATLHPGAMIFIPAGYYHAVTADTASVSVNAWFYSELSELYSLLENAPLPFDADESVAEQLTKLAVTLRRVLFLLGVAPSSFAEAMQARYAPLLAPSVLSQILSPEGHTERGNVDASTSSTRERVCIQERVLTAGKFSCVVLHAVFDTCYPSYNHRFYSQITRSKKTTMQLCCTRQCAPSRA
jgi:hypothetical protein